MTDGTRTFVAVLSCLRWGLAAEFGIFETESCPLAESRLIAMLLTHSEASGVACLYCFLSLAKLRCISIGRELLHSATATLHGFIDLDLIAVLSFTCNNMKMSELSLTVGGECSAGLLP